MRRLACWLSAVALIVLLVAAARATGQQPQAEPGSRGAAREFSLALTGDSIITRKLAGYQEPQFLKMIELIRGADAAFTNLEMLFHDYESYPMNESGGTWMRADPPLVKDLVWAGFDLVSRANNHTGDYGVAGLRSTSKYVSEAGLVQAGVGESLSAAREAKFLDTPNGRVALIAAASTFPDHSRASSTRGDVPPRPGLSPLRFTTTYVVTRERLEGVRAAMKEMGLNAPDGDRLNFAGRQFVVGDKPGVRTEPLKRDVDDIAAVVRSASRMADYTIVTVHAHEGDGDRTVPAQFLVSFARAMIDAGASVFTGHGPHVLRGVEIYKGRPILYSLGDFVFENETLLRFPTEAYEAQGLGTDAQVGDFNEKRSDGNRRGFNADREIWESVVATLRWRGSELTELKLHPISLGFGLSMSERGRPMFASPELGRKILDDVSKRSARFGTKLTIEDGVGKVVLSPRSSSFH
jgi:poly-gamma-glutamate capsule biosynthesis protein CapA/YwtB (metallophosphatase superfamily)